MKRKTGQMIALVAVFALIIGVVWYQLGQESQLRTTVLQQYGYPSPGATRPQSLPENPPRSSRDVNGIRELSYTVPYSSQVVLDALQLPQDVPSFYTVVIWVPDRVNYETVTLDDNRATRTFFMAPDSSGTLRFTLKAQKGGSLIEVGRYIIDVVDPLVLKADANQDDKYTFDDLVQLLQSWDNYGADATKVLSIILSRYEK